MRPGQPEVTSNIISTAQGGNSGYRRAYPLPPPKDGAVENVVDVGMEGWIVWLVWGLRVSQWGWSGG
jgi:hypothetical protein